MKRHRNAHLRMRIDRYFFNPLSSPLSDGFDAFCLGGPSFLGFRISLLRLR